MNCSNDMLPLGPIECREIPPRTITLKMFLYSIYEASKNLPRKKKKAYRKEQLEWLANEVKKTQLYAGDI